MLRFEKQMRAKERIQLLAWNVWTKQENTKARISHWIDWLGWSLTTKESCSFPGRGSRFFSSPDRPYCF